MQLVVELVQTVQAQIQAGTLRAIAVTSPQRFPAVPEIPTFAESGLPGYEMGSWYGLFAPAATPKDIVQRLSAETAKGLSAADLRTRFKNLGADPIGLSTEDSLALLGRELQRWSKVAKQAQVRAE